MKPLRICFTTNSSPWTKFHGGGQIFVHNVARALSKKGHQVIVIYTGPHFQSSSITVQCNYRIEWASYIGYPWTAAFRQMNAFTVYQKLKHLYNRGKLDVINAVGEEALFLPKFCRDTGTILFFSIEHPQLSSLRPNFRWLKLFRFFLALVRTRDLRVNRFVCRHAQGVITPSQYTKSEAVHYFNVAPSKIRVINHGIIDEMLFENSVSHERNIKGPLLFFGRLEPQKGVDLVIMTYHKLLKEEIVSEQKLILIGSGPHEKKYKRMVYKLGLRDKVHFQGWQSPKRIRDYMATASLCVLPSRSESFGLSMAETLAQDLPLVTSSAGSIPEVVDAGRGGWLAKPNDQDSLFHTICEALNNYPESIKKSRHGRDYVRDRFTWQKAARDYEIFYMDILHKGKQ